MTLLTTTTRFFSLLLPLIFLSFISEAQLSSGVKFEHGLTWSQIKEKARKEDKSIFLDAYTTWCGPCIAMDKKIFPQQKVGEFFNTNFINVKVQIDKTNKDSKEVKAWYADAHLIENTFNIYSYPTFLFLNSKGELIHRIDGASPTAEDFITKAAVALSPYAKDKQVFENGKRDSAFLLALIKDAQLRNDRKFLPVITNEYLATQDNLLTEENIRLLAKSTKKITDPGFKVLREDADQVDAILGKGSSKAIVEAVVFDEFVLPYLRTNGEKLDLGGMINYTGEVNKKVNWTTIENVVNTQFPDLTQDVLLSAKPLYFRWLEDWNAYTGFIFENKGRIRPDQLDSYANYVYLFSEDKQSLERARTWMKELVNAELQHKTWYLITYSNLLYKSGMKDAAIENMEKVIAQLPGEDFDHLKKILAKMKNNEKTW